MILWMLRCMLAATLVAGAAVALDESARVVGRPRRWGWVLAMVLAAGLPLALRLFPAAPPPAPAAAIDPALLADLAARVETAQPRATTLQALLTTPAADRALLAAWGVATLATGLVLLLTYRALRRERAGGVPVEIAGLPARLTRRTGPMVVGVRRPEVVVPDWIGALSDEERRLVVRHEWEHLRAGDSRLLLLSALLVALMPWNAPLWWLQRRLRQAVEVDCDARVLASGADCRLYGSILIQTAGRPVSAPMLAPALIHFPSLLERRIVAMTTRTPARPWLRLFPALTVGALLVAAACELTPRATARPTPTEPTAAEVMGAVTTLKVDTLSGPGTGPRASADHFRDWLIIMDGKRLDRLPDLAPGQLPRVSVSFIEGARAVEEYGPDGKNGVVSMTTRGTPVGHDGDIQLAPVRAPAAPGDTIPAGDVQAARVRVMGVTGARPLYIVDGTRTSSIDHLDPARIETLRVIKDPAATARYGPEARDGVVVVTLKPATAGGASVVGYGAPRAAGSSATAEHSATTDRSTISVRADGEAIVLRTAGGNPLILVDGRRVDSLSGLSPETVESVEVIKDERATARYGAEAKDGVVLISLKKR